MSTAKELGSIECVLAAESARRGKRNVLGVLVDAIDYNQALDRIIGAAREGRGAAISALAVHGVMTGASDAEQRYRLNHFDLILPDGQPVRWMLNLRHGAALSDRVYGPELTLRLCRRAALEGLPVYFYGSTPEVLERLRARLAELAPALQVAGMEPSKFRHITAEEKLEVAERIRASGARIVFVGLGCPRQEVFAYEFRELISLPLVAVGAAFPFLAGELAQAPPRMQAMGLEWLYRLWREPRRLWRRYLLLNPAYLSLAALQLLGAREFSTEGKEPERELRFG